MKKILFLLIACFTLGASAPLSMASAQTQTATTVIATNDSLQKDSSQDSLLQQAEQKIKRLEKEINWLEQQKAKNKSMIAITGTIFIFLTPFAVIFCWFYFRSRIQRSKLQTINKLLDSGQPISPELYQLLTNEQQRQDRNLMQRGIQRFFIGIGLTVFFWWMIGDKMGSVGIFVSCIGLGEIVAGYFQKKDEKKQLIQNEPTIPHPTQEESQDSTIDPQ